MFNNHIKYYRNEENRDEFPRVLTTMRCKIRGCSSGSPTRWIPRNHSAKSWSCPTASYKRQKHSSYATNMLVKNSFILLEAQNTWRMQLPIDIYIPRPPGMWLKTRSASWCKAGGYIVGSSISVYNMSPRLWTPRTSYTTTSTRTWSSSYRTMRPSSDPEASHWSWKSTVQHEQSLQQMAIGNNQFRRYIEKRPENQCNDESDNEIVQRTDHCSKEDQIWKPINA